MNTYARMPELSDEGLIGGSVTARHVAGWFVMGIASWGVVGAVGYALATYVVGTALHWVW